MARTIGIDLGTTNSVVAYIDGTRIETIANTEGSKLTPSCVFYKSDEEIIVGELAKRQFLATPHQCVRSIKRIMGKRYDELVEEMEDLPYTIVRLDDGMAGVELEGGIRLRPEEVSADVLDKMRQTAEIFLNEEITDAVITVPAHFNDQQRTATKVAAEMAGLNVLRIINEPTAAALAYGVGRDDGGGIVAVFDFGGGTFDVSILQISSDIYEVLSTNGDNHLGGDDIDLKLFQDICDTILQDHGIDPTQDIRAVQRIREAAEKAKCELSSLNSTMISLPFIVADSKGPKHYERELTRARFNEMMEPLFQRLFEPCRRAISDASLRVEQIKEVLLVGGSTRIPRVQELVAEFFGRQPNRTVNPDEAVAAGAAVQSGVITGALREVLLLDVTPLTLGIELAGGVFKPLIPRNSTIPCEASRKFTTVVDNQTSVLVHVLQGERAIAAENHSLAQFRLTGLPPAPKDLLEIEVHFSIDANGILSVAATELTTGQMTGVLVENYGEIGSRRDEIERLVQSAKKHADEDDRFRRFADKRQNAERTQDKANKLINAAGDLLSSEKIKVLKETMLKVDLAIAAMNEKELGTHESKLRDLMNEYEQDAELQRAISRSLNEANLRASHEAVQGLRVAQAEMPNESAIDEAVPQAAARVVMARTGGTIVGGGGEPPSAAKAAAAAAASAPDAAASPATTAPGAGKDAAPPPPAAKAPEPEPEPEPEEAPESLDDHAEGEHPRFQLRVKFDDLDDDEKSFDPSNMPLPPGAR